MLLMCQQAVLVADETQLVAGLSVLYSFNAEGSTNYQPPVVVALFNHPFASASTNLITQFCAEED